MMVQGAAIGFALYLLAQLVPDAKRPATLIIMGALAGLVELYAREGERKK